MPSINFHIDDDLKRRSFAELKKLGITPSELMRQALQYVIEWGTLPFDDEDDELFEKAKDRLAAPQRVKVSLDDSDFTDS
jgi:RHH-type rel operon transcriptional repressor/antitoxin RelB